jgi:predicted DNA-binding transcriptional regulator AlpA
MKASDRARAHDALDVLLDAVTMPPDGPPEGIAIPASPQVPAPLIDKRELARLLSVSRATIDRLVRDGLPYLPVGDVKRFDVAECRAWLVNRDKPLPPDPAVPPPASGPRGVDQGGVRLLSRANPRRARK